MERWQKLSNEWWIYGKPVWWVKYRGYVGGRLWQIVYFDMRKNHAVLQSEFTEEQLRHNLEMEYLLLRGEK